MTTDTRGSAVVDWSAAGEVEGLATMLGG